MNKKTLLTSATAVDGRLLFQFFKYTVYALLAMNVYHFFVEDYAASSQTFANGIGAEQIIEAFTATIDTAAWVILLLLFELETSVLDDDRIVGGVKWSLHGIRGACYLFIVYSFYGYASRYIMLHNIVPFAEMDLCTLIDSSFTYVLTIDEYLPFTAEACQAMNGQPIMQIVNTEILSTQEQLVETQRLSFTDLVNSGNWLIIVAILEIDVWLQLKGKLTPRIMLTSKAIKFVLYSILFLAAAYWGWKGDFLDFWDAFLWLVAFIFIELNIFEWNEETTAAQASTASP